MLVEARVVLDPPRGLPGPAACPVTLRLQQNGRMPPTWDELKSTAETMLD